MPMRNGFCVSLTALLVCAGGTIAQQVPVVVPPAASVLIRSANPGSPCGSDCCCEPAPPGGQLWVSGEYLLWWVKNGPLPVPLVTTGPFPPPPGVSPGVLGQPGTALVYGLTDLDYHTFSGVRVTAGSWLDADQTFGIEGRGFLLERKTNQFGAASDAAGNPVLAQPNIFNGMPERFTVSQADERSGSVAVPSSSRLWGAEANALWSLSSEGSLHVCALAGFRYLGLREGLGIDSFSTALNNGLPTNTVVFLAQPFRSPASVLVTDQFDTRNEFYGGQLGGRVDYTSGKLFGSLAVKVALGDTHEGITNTGLTTLIIPGQSNVTVSGGRLVAASNAGHFSRDEFSVVPEVEVKAGYQVTDHIKAFVGYDFLYWTGVVRPGNQIDLNVDARQIPTSIIFTPGFVGAVPTVPFRKSDFWAQGITFGLEFAF
jgi:hypothetical protein